MNYSVVEFLRQRLTKNMLLFEYGSGYSTLFFSKLVKKVVSVEYDKDWYERMSKEGLNENVTGSTRNLIMTVNTVPGFLTSRQKIGV
jgi:protein-L-isoaspartate O-methyltransferase